jgi:hypothetical protein
MVDYVLRNPLILSGLALILEVDPDGGTISAGLLVGFFTAPILLRLSHQAALSCCCCCCGCGHVGNALALSIMSTDLSPSGPLVPSRHTAMGVLFPSA